MPSHRVFLLLLNILVIPMACGPAAAQTQVLGPISDETPPAVCSSGSFVTGIRCTGSYCDNIKITCTNLPGAATDGYRWTPWVSEETFPGYCTGPVPMFIAGFACNGKYCDNISLFCVYLANADLFKIYRCWTTRSVSEEQGGTLSFQEGSSGGSGIVVATQMSCSGSYCDNKTFYVCQIGLKNP
jgi:hypothetical protein